MKRFYGVFTGFILALAIAVLFNTSPEVAAQSAVQSGVDAARGTGVPSTLFGDGSIITTITNTLLFLVGALAVIMIIWGGIRYATSAGNSSSVTAAKNTILYAIVGLIIAFLAFAAVNWILVAITPGAGGTSGFTNV